MNYTVENDWLEILNQYPPLLSPKQVEDASQGLLTASMIYRRASKDRPDLELDVRRFRGKPKITRASLLKYLCGKIEKPC